MKKALSLVLAMLMLMSVFSVSAFAATTPVITEAYAGYFGATLIWSADVSAAGYGVFRYDSADSEAELIADVAQTAGIVGINMQEMNISALAFTGHKGLLGPMGTGALLHRNLPLSSIIKPSSMLIRLTI